MTNGSNTPESNQEQKDRMDWPNLLLFACLALSLALAAMLIYSFNLPPAEGQTAPPAADYLAFWGAGHMALNHQAPQAYDTAILTLVQNQGLGREEIQYLPWLNPPPFFLFVTPFALAPFLASHYIWAYFCLAFYSFAVYQLIPNKTAVFAALAYPAIFFCVVIGQTGIVTAALLGLFTIWHGPRPILAGIAIGCMIIKPQLALLTPFVLIASGNWRTFFSAAATVVVLCVITTILFGFDVWTAFGESMKEYSHRASTLEHYLTRIQSIYGLVILLSKSAICATIIQSIVSFIVFVTTIIIWRKPFSYELKGAAFIVGSLMITPYIQIYDYPIMAFAGLFLWKAGQKTGFLPWEKTIIISFACSFLACFFLQAPIWGGFMLLPFGLILQRAWHEKARFQKE